MRRLVPRGHLFSSAAAKRATAQHRRVPTGFEVAQQAGERERPCQREASPVDPHRLSPCFLSSPCVLDSFID